MLTIVERVMGITLHRAVMFNIKLINPDAVIQTNHMGVLLWSVTKVIYTFDTIDNLVQQHILVVIVRTRGNIDIYVVGQFKWFNSSGPV